MNDLRKLRYWLVLLVNWALVPCAGLTYRGGAPVWGAYLLIQVGMVILIDRVAKSRWTLAFLCANLLAATVIAHRLSTQHYYDHVNTYLTMAIGTLGKWLGALAVAVLSAVAVMAKGRKWKS